MTRETRPWCSRCRMYFPAVTPQPTSTTDPNRLYSRAHIEAALDGRTVLAALEQNGYTVLHLCGACYNDMRKEL